MSRRGTGTGTGTLTKLVTVGTLAFGLLLGTLQATAAIDSELPPPTLEFEITERQVVILDTDADFFRRPPVTSPRLLVEQQPRVTFARIDPTDV